MCGHMGLVRVAVGTGRESQSGWIEIGVDLLSSEDVETSQL